MKLWLTPSPATPDTDSSDDHWVCCRNDNIGYCGTDVSDLPWTDFDRASCVVCDDLDESIDADTCPLTGQPCPTEEQTA